jgi:membrane fusion protein (multidrug efflux system)
MTPASLFALFILAAATPVPAGDAPASYAAHLMVDQDTIVMARITGTVAEILVDRGTPVKKGQPLANLDSREADADVRQTKEDMELKKTEFDRAQALTTSAIGSQADLDEKRAQYQVAVAAHEKAKALRDYTVIRAPFDGVVTEKYARLGQKVVDIVKDPLFKITASGPLLARIYVPEKELGRVRRGASVEVIPTNFPKARAPGAIDYISPIVDPASGTFEVIIRVRPPAGSLMRPGMAVEVRVPSASSP